MKKEESFILKITKWIGMAFLWGMGILFLYVCLEALVEFIRSLNGDLWIFPLSFTIVGGFVMSIYNKSFK